MRGEGDANAGDMPIEGIMQQEVETMLQSFKEKYATKILEIKVAWSEKGNIIGLNFKEERYGKSISTR